MMNSYYSNYYILVLAQYTVTWDSTHFVYHANATLICDTGVSHTEFLVLIFSVCACVLLAGWFSAQITQYSTALLFNNIHESYLRTYDKTFWGGTSHWIFLSLGACYWSCMIFISCDYFMICFNCTST